MIGLLIVALATAASAASKGHNSSGHPVKGAEGNSPKAVVTCGETVTTSVTLMNDVGPCTGDGIDVMGSNIRINLNGHSITGSNTTNTSNDQQLGINLMNVHHVTVTGPGTISHFDAGVGVNGGYGNKITRLTAEDNVAHVLLTGGVDQTDPEATACDYGDGITTDNSNGNVISRNVVTRNGPFSGVSLVDSSNGNNVNRNHAFDNNVSNILTGTAALAGTPGPCGPFGANIVGQGRPHQDIGIRIEGPGATNNIIANNVSTDNQLEGISIHGNVCPDNPAGVPAGDPNIHNVVKNNLVLRNGFADDTDGIGVLSQGPARTVCVAYENTIIGNTSSYNAHDGIMIGGRGSHGNVIRENRTNHNGRDGISLTGPASGLPGAINNLVANNRGFANATFDGADYNPACDNNVWRNNHFVTVNQACVAARGTGS